MVSLATVRDRCWMPVNRGLKAVFAWLSRS